MDSRLLNPSSTTGGRHCNWLWRSCCRYRRIQAKNHPGWESSPQAGPTRWSDLRFHRWRENR